MNTLAKFATVSTLALIVAAPVSAQSTAPKLDAGAEVSELVGRC